MSFIDLAKERYSCRKISGRKVEKELIDKIIQAAVSAPTAVNNQPVKVWVLESAEAAENVRKVTSCSFGAETFMVVGGKRDEAWNRTFDGKNFAEVDAAIVATHMMLEIQDLGLATTWVGYFDAPALKEIYPQMKDYELVAMFPIGYAEDDKAAEPSPRHFIRKSSEELTEKL